MNSQKPRQQWRDVVQSNIGITERLKRNVLEIQLDKEENSDDVEEKNIVTLFEKLGIKKETVEGVQLVPQRSPRKIFVWFNPSVNLNNFCYEDAFRLGAGVKTGRIKPMDRREVEVLIKGLNINTPDSSVISYLGHFGKIMKTEVIYMKNKEGPFAGLKNGDRKYFVDFTGGRNLDSYHLIDGVKVLVSYPGQRRTCGRCHQTPSQCRGNGLARNYEVNGSTRINLRQHMETLWGDIGYKPKISSEENPELRNLSRVYPLGTFQ